MQGGGGGGSSSNVATAPCAQGPARFHPATLMAQTGAHGPVAGAAERSRASERLEASVAGLAELELLRRRQEALVRGVLEAPSSADQDHQHHHRQQQHQQHASGVSGRQRPPERDFEESLRAMKEQLGCLRQRDLGLLSRLRHLDQQISELKLDVDRAAVKQSETDSRPSSGYYDLSDGSLSNSCNSIFSDCLSGSRSSLGSCSPPGRVGPGSPAGAAGDAHPGFPSELSLFRAGADPREACGPCPAAGTSAAAQPAFTCPQQQGRARERPLSSGDLLRARGDASVAGTATRRSLPDSTAGPSPPGGCPSARGPDAGGRYHSDLTSRDGSDVYRYPSPLHAVAIQSPLFLHCPGGAAATPHDARASRRPGGGAQRPCSSGFVPSPAPVPLSRDGAANERVSGYICSLLDRKHVPAASGGTGAKLSRMASFNAGPNMPITNGRLKPKQEEKAASPEDVDRGADPKPDALHGVDSCQEVTPEQNVQAVNESESPRCHQQKFEASPSPKSKEQTKLVANVLPLRCNDSPKRVGGLPPHPSRVKGLSRVERYEEDSKPPSSRVSHQAPRSTHATPGKGAEPRYRDAAGKPQVAEERHASAKDRSRAPNASNHGGVIKATHGKLDRRAGGRSVASRAQPRADAGDHRSSGGNVLHRGHRAGEPHHRSMESVESRRKGAGRKTVIKSSRKYVAHADWNGNKRLGPTKARPLKAEEQRARRRDEVRTQNPAACAERCCRDVVSRVEGRGGHKNAVSAAGAGGRGVKRLAQQPKSHSRDAVQPHGAAHGRAPPPPQQQQQQHRRRSAPPRAHAPALAHARMARAYATAAARADSDSERSEYSAECESLFHGTVMDTSEDEMSDHTTNRFGDGETSASEGVPCSEIDEEEEDAADSDSDVSGGGFSVSTGSSSASDEDEEEEHGDAGRQQSKGLLLAGRRAGQKAPAAGPEARGGARAQPHAVCRIKASRSLKKKMMHFRSGSLKVITTV